LLAFSMVSWKMRFMRQMLLSTHLVFHLHFSALYQLG
jgi:hypothetical protein